MNRRKFLTASGALAAGLAGGAVMVRRAKLPPPSLDALIGELTALRAQTLSASGAWSPIMIFHHLAQSVDYSMSGYPESKSPAFQHTVGRAALFVFTTAGAMRHALSEPIPGAPALEAGGSTADAIDRLIGSLSRFAGFSGALMPHFAYGALSKIDYRAAHVLHVRNHLEEILVV